MSSSTNRHWRERISRVRFVPSVVLAEGWVGGRVAEWSTTSSRSSARSERRVSWDCDVEVWSVRLVDIPLHTAYEHKLIRPGDHWTFFLLIDHLDWAFRSYSFFFSLILTDFFCSCASVFIHIPLISRFRRDDKLNSSITRELFAYEPLDFSTYSCPHLSHTWQTFYFLWRRRALPIPSLCSSRKVGLT
jgi:hypothetical protein